MEKKFIGNKELKEHVKWVIHVNIDIEFNMMIAAIANVYWMSTYHVPVPFWTLYLY